jgi:hypothetical protein
MSSACISSWIVWLASMYILRARLRRSKFNFWFLIQNLRWSPSLSLHSYPFPLTHSFYAYVTCAELSNIEKLKLDWNFPKTHLWKHIVHNIQRKGVVRNFSMHPNEKMHSPLKDTYHHQMNGKDVAMQVSLQFPGTNLNWTDHDFFIDPLCRPP